jgi:hypothetical protein
MIERLRVQWREGMSFNAIINLRDEMEAMLQGIRSERQIRTPVFKCPQCGQVAEGDEPHVSVRALILSVIRFKIAPAEATHIIEKGWNAYRKQKGLDLYGKAEIPRSDRAGCAHPQVS